MAKPKGPQHTKRNAEFSQSCTQGLATRSACYRGPKLQNSPKWLGEGAKGVLANCRKGLPRASCTSATLFCTSATLFCTSLTGFLSTYTKTPLLTCFHASFCPFPPLFGHPFSSPSLGTLSPFSPPRKVLYSVEQNTQHRERGRWTSPQSSGRKFLPEICVKKGQFWDPEKYERAKKRAVVAPGRHNLQIFNLFIHARLPIE